MKRGIVLYDERFDRIVVVEVENGIKVSMEKIDEAIETIAPSEKHAMALVEDIIRVFGTNNIVGAL